MNFTLILILSIPVQVCRGILETTVISMATKSTKKFGTVLGLFFIIFIYNIDLVIKFNGFGFICHKSFDSNNNWVYDFRYIKKKIKIILILILVGPQYPMFFSSFSSFAFAIILFFYF